MDVPFGEDPTAPQSDDGHESTGDEADLDQVHTNYGTYYHSVNGTSFVAHASKYKAYVCSYWYSEDGANKSPIARKSVAPNASFDMTRLGKHRFRSSHCTSSPGVGLVKSESRLQLLPSWLG